MSTTFSDEENTIKTADIVLQEFGKYPKKAIMRCEAAVITLSDGNSFIPLCVDCKQPAQVYRWKPKEKKYEFICPECVGQCNG